MAQACVQQGITGTATFSLYMRPEERRPWFLAGGFEHALAVIAYRGHPLTPHVSGDHVRVASEPGDRAPIRVACRGRTAELRPGETVELSG